MAVLNRLVKLLSTTLILSLPLSASASIDFEKIAKEVKGFLGDQLTKAYCMIKKDCHQRVIYLMNLSDAPIKVNGCHFETNQVIPAGEKAFTARKNSKGHGCEVSITKEGETNTIVTLSPYEHYIHFTQQYHSVCLTDHKVLKSWHKCPWGCGKYEVHGYIGACAIM